MKKSRKGIGGRPTVMTPEAIDKLYVAFSLGCSDIEACYFANLSPATMYAWQERHPEFLEIKLRLKQKPVFQARSTLMKGIQRDPRLALKFLERVKKDEFSLKTEVEVQGQVAAVFRWEGEPERIDQGSEPIEIAADEVLTAITDAVDQLDVLRGTTDAVSEASSVGYGDGGTGGKAPARGGLPVDPSIQNSEQKQELTEPDSVNRAPFKIAFPKIKTGG